MKILLASDAYTYQTNGVKGVVMTLAREFRLMGHSVRVLAPSNTRKSFMEGDDCYFGSIPAFYYPDVRMSLKRREPMAEELKRWKPDVVHIHSESSASRLARSVASACHAPIVMTSHTDYAQYVFGRFKDSLPARAVIGAWGRIAYRGTAAVIAPSEKALNFVQLKSVRDHATVIPNGISLETFRRPFTGEEKTALLEQCGLRDNGKTLVMVTRVSHEKNIREIIEYFPALLERDPEVQLLIVGDGPARGRLEELTREKGLAERVRFTGRIDRDQLYRYYRLGELFVSASTFEVHSLTYLEAIACGVPLLCRDDASLKGVMMNGENGYAYRTKEEFVEDALRVLGDPALRARMSENASRKADEFSDRRFAERVLELYGDVLRRRA